MRKLESSITMPRAIRIVELENGEWAVEMKSYPFYLTWERGITLYATREQALARAQQDKLMFESIDASREKLKLKVINSEVI